MWHIILWLAGISMGFMVAQIRRLLTMRTVEYLPHPYGIEVEHFGNHFVDLYREALDRRIAELSHLPPDHIKSIIDREVNEVINIAQVRGKIPEC